MCQQMVTGFILSVDYFTHEQCIKWAVILLNFVVFILDI